jgi:hypothetical protein
MLLSGKQDLVLSDKIINLFSVRMGDVPQGDERGRHPRRVHGHGADVQVEGRQRRKDHQHGLHRRNSGS